MSYLGAPRPVPLHHRANTAQMTFGLYVQPDETRGSGHLWDAIGHIIDLFTPSEMRQLIRRSWIRAD